MQGHGIIPCIKSLAAKNCLINSGQALQYTELEKLILYLEEQLCQLHIMGMNMFVQYAFG